MSTDEGSAGGAADPESAEVLVGLVVGGLVVEVVVETGSRSADDGDETAGLVVLEGSMLGRLVSLSQLETSVIPATVAIAIGTSRCR